MSNVPLSLNKGLSNLQKMEGRFDEVYSIYGVLGNFYYMEDIEDTQYFDEYNLPDIVPSDYREDSSDKEGNESVV